MVLGGVGKRRWTAVSTLCSMPAIACCTDCVIMACSICIPANEGFGAGPLDEDAGCGAGGIDGGGIDAGGGVAICCYIWLDDRSNRQKRMLVRPGESRWESYLSLALNCTRPCNPTCTTAHATHVLMMFNSYIKLASMLKHLDCSELLSKSCFS